MNFYITTTTQTRLRRQRRKRGAFLYVAVLFTTLIVMVSVTTALTISTSNLRGETDRSSRGQALRFAESELHRQAAIMRTSSLWRSSEPNNVFSSWHPITVNGIDITGTSQVRHRFNDPDGSLTDDLTDEVELTVHAKVGRSEAALTVVLESDPFPLSLLRYSVTCSDEMEFNSGAAVVCERRVQVANDCKSDGTGFLTTPQLECDGNIEMTLRGDLAEDAVGLPNHDVVGKYISIGTEIPHSAIPQSGGDLLIEDRVLSPTVNPFGSVDPDGIYWIDARGDGVILSHCRFDATLAIRDAGEILIRGGISWNYPTSPDVILVTDSRILCENVESSLSESARSINFNPPSSPYRQTIANTTTTDNYPTELRGVIYTSDDFLLKPLLDGQSLHLTGALIGERIRVEGLMQITQLDELLRTPPPGLSNPAPMRFVRGTFRRISSPQ